MKDATRAVMVEGVGEYRPIKPCKGSRVGKPYREVFEEENITEVEADSHLAERLRAGDVIEGQAEWFGEVPRDELIDKRAEEIFTKLSGENGDEHTGGLSIRAVLPGGKGKPFAWEQGIEQRLMPIRVENKWKGARRAAGLSELSPADEGRFGQGYQGSGKGG